MIDVLQSTKLILIFLNYFCVTLDPFVLFPSLISHCSASLFFALSVSSQEYIFHEMKTRLIKHEYDT